MTGTQVDQDEAWQMYTWMEATQWRFLPRAGGLEDQDEILLDNIFAIAAAVEKTRHPGG